MKYDTILTRDYLLKEYTNKNRSINSLSKEKNIKRETIKKYLIRNNISLHLPDYTKRKGYCNGHWGGYKEIPLSYWSQVISNAKKRNTLVSISIEDGWELFLKQNRKCSLSGHLIEFLSRKQTTASLDRIDSSKGYIKGNVQWLHKDVNNLKSNWIQKDFIEMCKIISKFQNEKENKKD